MNILEVKKKYNYWLGRYLKAEEFINSSEPEEVDKYLGLFHQIVRELSLLIQEFRKATGKEMTKKEMYEGFNEVKNDSCNL